MPLNPTIGAGLSEEQRLAVERILSTEKFAVEFSFIHATPTIQALDSFMHEMLIRANAFVGEVLKKPAREEQDRLTLGFFQMTLDVVKEIRDALRNNCVTKLKALIATGIPLDHFVTPDTIKTLDAAGILSADNPIGNGQGTITEQFEKATQG